MWWNRVEYNWMLLNSINLDIWKNDGVEWYTLNIRLN